MCEAPRTDTKKRHGVGKSDQLDAHHIAVAALPLSAQKLRRPRLNDGARQALRILVTARDAMSTERTRSVNSLTALLHTQDLRLDARKALSGAQITERSRWRAREEVLSLSVARAEAIRLAKHVLELDDQLKANEKQLTALVQISEAAYASLAGVNPIPASSGNPVRHRLNRGGDRSLNHALHMVALTRMTHEPETRKYVEKRRAQGLTDQEIRRCLKRHLARSIYRELNAASFTSAKG